MVEELLAQTVEELSIISAHGYARREPKRVPRPDHLTAPAGPGGPDGGPNPFAAAIDRLASVPKPRRGGGG